MKLLSGKDKLDELGTFIPADSKFDWLLPQRFAMKGKSVVKCPRVAAKESSHQSMHFKR